MSRNTRRVILLLDETKSMQRYTQEIIDGYNLFLDIHRDNKFQKTKSKFQSLVLTTAKFDECWNEYTNDKIENLPKLEDVYYNPAYGMPLHRALTKTIDTYSEGSDTENTMVIMVTDGHGEFLDKLQTKMLSEKIEKLKQEKSWKFYYCSAPYKQYSKTSIRKTQRRSRSSSPSDTKGNNQRSVEKRHSIARLYNFDFTIHSKNFYELWEVIASIVERKRKRRRSSSSSPKSSRKASSSSSSSSTQKSKSSSTSCCDEMRDSVGILSDTASSEETSTITAIPHPETPSNNTANASTDVTPVRKTLRDCSASSNESGIAV